MGGNKFPIAWHKEAYHNWELYIEREEKKILSLVDDLNRMKKEADFYKLQIEKAEAENRDEFDSDKFMVKKVIKE